MEIILGLIIIMLLVVILVIKTKPNEKEMTILSSAKLPFEVKKQLQSHEEILFYNALKFVIGDQAAICPKVTLKDFIEIKEGFDKDYDKYYDMISKKHVDFLLCDKDTYAPICAVELKEAISSDVENEPIKTAAKETMLKEFLNSASEENAPVWRDAVVSKVCKDAAFPLITFKIKEEYSLVEFSEKLSKWFTFEGIKQEKINTLPYEENEND